MSWACYMLSPQRHLTGLHVNPTGRGWVSAPVQMGRGQPLGDHQLAWNHRGRGLPALSAILLSVSLNPRLYIGFVVVLGKWRPCPESVPEPVPLQGPSTSSQNTAATVTWWTTCTATSTPSCSATPTSTARPVPSSTAMPCRWGSPYPGMREAAPSECLPSMWVFLVQEPKMRMQALGQIHFLEPAL